MYQINCFHVTDCIPEGMEEMGQMASGFVIMGLQMINMTRVGNDVVVTLKDAIEPMVAAIAPFSPVTSTMNISIQGSLAFAQPLQKLIAEKHNPLYSAWNGVAGELKINLDKDLVNKVSAVAGMDTSMPGQVAHLAYRMFRKMTFEVSTEDINTLP